MNSSQLSNEDYDIKLFKVFDKLKNAKSLIVQLSESHALIDSLKSMITMLFDIIDSLENKLKKISSDNLKSMLCIHSDISNKPGLIVDDLGASTSHAFASELDSIVIKPVIVDTACLDNSKNSCLNNYVKPKSKDTGTQAHG
jgi:hypothetical protein